MNSNNMGAVTVKLRIVWMFYSFLDKRLYESYVGFSFVSIISPSQLAHVEIAFDSKGHNRKFRSNVIQKCHSFNENLKIMKQ